MSETNTDAFCWVKAVLKMPPPVAESSSGETHRLDHPLLAALNLHAHGVVLKELTVPPAPKSVSLAHFERDFEFLGGKVPPPSVNDIPRTPKPSNGGAPIMPATSPSASILALPIPGYWQQVSYVPGMEYVPGQPVVTLLFQPVPGPRDDAELWRDANPLWFRDAIAATLLNHSL